MNLTPISSILIPPDRQRKTFSINEHQELLTSITETEGGLLHPIVLRESPEGLTLLAGERRLRAIAAAHELGLPLRCLGRPVPHNQVPYVLANELSPLAVEESELEENVKRVNLTWDEQSRATARLHSLRLAQALEKNLPPPTIRDISLELRDRADGSYQDQTRKEILVAKHLDNPEVKKAKSLDEAFKILKKQETAAKLKTLADTVGSSVKLSSHSLHRCDAREWLRDFGQPNTFDVILSDPPYGMGADEFGDSGGLAAGAHGYADSKEYWRELMSTLPREFFRVAKPDAHMYLFCDIGNFEELKQLCTAAGWKVFRTPLIWYKPTASRTPWVNKGPRRQYEAILFAVKNDRSVLCIRGDVLQYNPDENLGHAAQKPVALYTDLLQRSAMPGDKVLDAFAGSGPIFPAATACKCFATGIERDEQSYAIAYSRLEK